MAKERMDKLTSIATQFKEAIGALEELARELGNTSFEGGEEDMPENKGGEPVKQTLHQEPNPAEDLGALKSAGTDLAKSIGEAIAASLAKAGVVQPQPKPENELLAKFNELNERLKRIENQPAEAQAVAIPVDRRHVLDPDKKKSYEGAVSDLAKQVSNLNDKEREKLAAEIIKMINGR